ncbi:hypothetical protein CW711_00010 [Candidatus Bathyarchaeota archaeon]|nr:MAG: hypothetical protein CW711_00010 [Candidatus Bathyarchaeota archaeon]
MSRLLSRSIGRLLLRSLLTTLAIMIAAFTFLGSFMSLVEAYGQNALEVHVNRVIRVDDGGALTINDTITVSKGVNGSITSLSKFLVGIPRGFERNLVKVYAYNGSVRLNVRNISFGRADIRGFEVLFPNKVNLDDVETYSFTVIYVFSGLVSSETSLRFRFEFPKYPTLEYEVQSYNLTVVLPPDAEEPAGSIPFNETTDGDSLILKYSEGTVSAFAKDSAWVTFSSADFKLLEVNEMTRRITVDEWGNIAVSDRYYIINRATSSVFRLSLRIPRNATSISAQDIYGSLKVAVKRTSTHVEVEVSLRRGLKEGERVKLLIAYKIPSGLYLEHEGWDGYTLTMKPLTYNNWWIVEKLDVVIVLPEGARFQTSIKDPSRFEKNAFQETITFTEYNVTAFDELSLNLKYRYGVLWPSFRPTVWVGLLTSILAVFLYLRGPTKLSVPTVPVPVETIREFIGDYEEKRRILQNLEIIERQVRRGKISRRRYKVRRDSLERRLSRLQKRLNVLREELESTSRRYAELMGDLEVAEAELEAVKASLERLRSRYRRREISSETYDRLLDDYNRRRERAESTIDEVLLRLEEELR